MAEGSFISRALNRTFFYGFSSILGKIVGFIMLPIYTNYLTPEDYGVAGFLVFYVSLTQILLGGKLEHAISKFHYDKERNDSLASILSTATITTIVIAGTPLLVSMYFSENISQALFDSTEYSLAVKVISLNILFGTLELYGLQYIKIIDLPKTYLALNLLKLVTQLSINIFLIVFLDKGILGVVVSSAFAAILITLSTSLIVVVKEKGFYLKAELMKDLLWFSAPLWVSGLLGLYSGSISQVFIKEFAGLSDLGLYNLAWTFGALVATLAWTPFFNYWSVERYRIHEKTNAKETFQKVFYWSTAVTLFISFGVAVFSDPVIRIMANPEFHEAANAVAPLAIFNVVMYLGWFLNFSFLVTGNNKEIAHNGFVYAILITIAFFLFIPTFGFVGAAYGLLAANIVNLHIIEWRAKKYYNIEVSMLNIDLMLVITLIAIFGFDLINSQFENPYLGAATNGSILVFIISLSAALMYFSKPLLFTNILKTVRSRNLSK